MTDTKWLSEADIWIQRAAKAEKELAAERENSAEVIGKYVAIADQAERDLIAERERNRELVEALTYCKLAMEQEAMYQMAIEKADSALAKNGGKP